MKGSYVRASLMGLMVGVAAVGCGSSNTDTDTAAADATGATGATVSTDGTASTTDDGATVSASGGDGTSAGESGGDGDASADAGTDDGMSGDGDVGGDGDGDESSDSSDAGGEGGDGDAIKFDVGDGIMGDAGGACDEVTVTGEPEPPNIMLLLDRSCSMIGQRWTDLQAVVSTLVANYDAEVNFGAQFFPEAEATGNEQCNVNLDVPVAPMNGATITNLITSLQPDWDTPIYPAVALSIQHLEGLASQGDKVQILVADGDVNGCGEVSDVETALTAAYNAGADPSIPTYAVSVGGDVAQLTAFAVAGGTMDYIPTTDLSSLNAAIDSIVEGVISCKIALDPPPDYPEEVEVSIAGVVYPQLPSATSCGDGWYYTTPAKDELELCGAACDQLKVTFQADIAYKCPQN